MPDNDFFKGTPRYKSTVAGSHGRVNKMTGTRPHGFCESGPPMSVTPPCHSLFVYGTLLRRCGHPMARFLAERGTYRGSAKVPGRLYDLGPYPAAIDDHDANEWIFGDLYDIDDATLGALDDYEGEESPQPAFFGRRLQQVTLDAGGDAEAWVYWFHGPLPASAVHIATGKYEKLFRE